MEIQWIILIILIFLNILYYLIKKNCYTNILKEFKRQTKGNIKIDTIQDLGYVHEGTHYLSTTKYHNSQEHIHLWLDNQNLLEPIRYIYKKPYNFHSPIRSISLFSCPIATTQKMINEFENFI